MEFVFLPFFFDSGIRKWVFESIFCRLRSEWYINIMSDFIFYVAIITFDKELNVQPIPKSEIHEHALNQIIFTDHKDVLFTFYIGSTTPIHLV